jgi:hypothetical protein
MAFHHAGRFRFDDPINLGNRVGGAKALHGGKDTDHVANGAEAEDKNAGGTVHHDKHFPARPAMPQLN